MDQDNTLSTCDGGPKPVKGVKYGRPPPLLKKTYEMVEDPTTDSIISWSESGKSFIIWDPHKLSTHLLSQRFRHNNFTTFVTQLYTYRFKKVDADRWEFANELFQKGKKHLLEDIKQRTSQARKEPPPLAGHETELKKLESDRIDQLNQVILRIKQQQEDMVKNLCSVQERMRETELKQQRLVKLMSKVFKHQIGQNEKNMLQEILSTIEPEVNTLFSPAELSENELIFGIQEQDETFMRELKDSMLNSVV